MKRQCAMATVKHQQQKGNSCIPQKKTQNFCDITNGNTSGVFSSSSVSKQNSKAVLFLKKKKELGILQPVLEF